MIELHLFVPQQDGTYASTLVEDDGLTFAAQQGACYRTTFTVTRSAEDSPAGRARAAQAAEPTTGRTTEKAHR